MAQDAATKAVIQDFVRQGKETASEETEFPLVPSEQRTRAATAINELHSAATDDADPGLPVALLLHTMDDKAEPTRALWSDVLGTLSDGVQVEMDKPNSWKLLPAQDPEVGIRRTVVAAETLRQQVVGAVDTHKRRKRVHEHLRKSVFGTRDQAKSRAEWEIEITGIAAGIRRPETRASGGLVAFLPQLDSVASELKAALPQGGKSRIEVIEWSLGVRETTFALALALGSLLEQSYTRATPARQGRLSRAIDPKRSADSSASTGKAKTGAESGATPNATPGATQSATPGATPNATPGAHETQGSPSGGQTPGGTPGAK